MARFFDSSRSLANNRDARDERLAHFRPVGGNTPRVVGDVREGFPVLSVSSVAGFRNVSRFRKHQPGTGSEPGQPAVQRQERARVPADQARQYGDGRKDAPARDERRSQFAAPSSRYSATGRSPGCLSSDAVRIRRPCSRKCTRDCRWARLGTETSSSPPGRSTRCNSASATRLFLERQVLEHVEAQRAIEHARGIRQRRDRPGVHALGRVVGIDAFDRQPVRVLADEHALAAARVEHARRARQRIEPAAHGASAWRGRSDSSPTKGPAPGGSRRARRTRLRAPPVGWRS